MDERMKLELKNGRGAQVNPDNKFSAFSYLKEEDFKEYQRLNEEGLDGDSKTKYLEVYPKSIVNKVNSPDLNMKWSMNPYQGCEHGCSYCYARVTHEFWGYSTGSEFEQVILVKQNAGQLLEQKFRLKSWEPETIMLSGNTDCYQPAEAKFGITRQMLEVLLKYKNPVGIITKNALILRDLDLLVELNKDQLVGVSISVTTLDETLRRKLEPRTATIKRRLQTIETLSSRGIPVNVMIAPIIPGLNSHEVLNIAKAASDAGALSIHHTMVRLNGSIGAVFTNWLEHHYPDRRDKILNQVSETHGGHLNDSRFGTRIRGQGEIAAQVKKMIQVARKKYFQGRSMPELNTGSFIRAPKGQLGLFN